MEVWELKLFFLPIVEGLKNINREGGITPKLRQLSSVLKYENNVIPQSFIRSHAPIAKVAILPFLAVLTRFFFSQYLPRRITINKRNTHSLGNEYFVQEWKRKKRTRNELVNKHNEKCNK